MTYLTHCHSRLKPTVYFHWFKLYSKHTAHFDLAMFSLLHVITHKLRAKDVSFIFVKPVHAVFIYTTSNARIIICGNKESRISIIQVTGVDNLSKNQQHTVF